MKMKLTKNFFVILIPASEDGNRLQINDSSFGRLFSFLKYKIIGLTHKYQRISGVPFCFILFAKFFFTTCDRIKRYEWMNKEWLPLIILTIIYVILNSNNIACERKRVSMHLFTRICLHSATNLTLVECIKNKTQDVAYKIL